MILTGIQLFFATLRTYELMLFKTFREDVFRRIFAINWSTSFICNIVPFGLLGDLYRIRELISQRLSIIKDNTVYSSIYSKYFSLFSLLLFALITGLLSMKAFSELDNLVVTVSIALLILVLMFLFRKIIIAQMVKYLEKIDYIKNKSFYLRRISNLKNYNSDLSLNSFKIYKTVLYSMIIQTLNVISFMIIIYQNNSNVVSAYQLFCLTSIGMIIVLLPFSYNGLGVGHVAFSKLLLLNGIPDGADMFSVFFAYSYIFNAIGGLFFLGLCRSNKLGAPELDVSSSYHG
jgi:uncharacterized membrane protein YbhN (UPF0104 family)